MNDARSWIEMAQIQAELPQDRKSVDPGCGTQVFHTLKPTFHDPSGNWLSWLELAHQKAIHVPNDFLATRIISASGTTRLEKCLEPKRQWTAKKAGCHRFILFWARASPLLEDFSDPPWHR
jgi:hypothetical protein